MTTAADKLRAALSLVKTGKPSSLLPPTPSRTLLTAADDILALQAADDLAAQSRGAAATLSRLSLRDRTDKEINEISARLARNTAEMEDIQREVREAQELTKKRKKRADVDSTGLTAEIRVATARLQNSAAKLQKQIDVDMARLDAIHAAHARVGEAQQELGEANADYAAADARAKMLEDQLRTLTGSLGKAAESAASADTSTIDMVIGCMTYPSKTKGAIPIFPIIEVWIKADGHRVTDFMKTFKPSHLHLSIEDRRYKIYEESKENEPFAQLDEPVGEMADKVFQGLYKHWDQWFLRVHGTAAHWDFQIKNTRCFALTATIERTLDVIGIDPERTVAAVIQDALDHKKHVVLRETRKMLKQMATLAGPLPVPRAGYHPDTCPPGKIFAWVRQSAYVSRWVTLDEDNLLKQVQKIVGTPFQTVVLEDCRPGVDLVHTVSRDDTAPTVWFRAVRQEPRQVVKVKVDHVVFDKSQISTLYDDDLPSIEKFYRLPTKNLGSISRNTSTSIESVRVEDDLHATEVDKAMHEAIVKNFLLVSQTVHDAANDGEPGAIKCWPHIRNAVLFELPPVAYVTLFNEFMQFIARLAKMDINAPLEKYTAKQWKRVRGILSTGEDAPFPEKMPFDACFFAYGGGVTDPSADLLSAELKHHNAVATDVGRLYGHLVTSTGIVAGFRYVTDHVNARKGIAVTYDRDPAVSHKWDRVQTLAPWIINALVEYVNEHKSIIEQGKNGLAHQMLVKKAAKVLNIKPPKPPPFYVVRMKDQLIREQVQRRGASIKRHIDWQHRWNVRGHDCIRFARGFMPLDENVEADFVERGYKVFKGDDIVDSTLFNALMRRGVEPKHNNEWMAILSYWRESFVKGPEDKPLVESTRQSTKKWDRSTDWGKIDVRPDEES